MLKQVNLNNTVQFKPTSYGEALIREEIRKSISGVNTYILQTALSYYVQAVKTSDGVQFSKINTSEFFIGEDGTIKSEFGFEHVIKLLDTITFPRNSIGLVEMQLWEFSSLFGNNFHNGSESVCENNSILMNV